MFMKADMAEDEATGKLEKSNFASELGEQNPDQDKAGEKADAKLLQKANSEAQAVDEGFMDTDYAHVCYDSAEDADDEIDTDDGYEKIRPLNIKKIKNGKASDQGMQ